MLPQDFLNRMQTQLGAEYTEYLASLERPRAVALRFNPLKGETPQLPFVKENVPYWQATVSSALKSEAHTEWLMALPADSTITASDFGMGFVG